MAKKSSKNLRKALSKALKKLPKKVRIVALSILIPVFILCIVLASFSLFGKEGKLTTISKSSLQEILEINELSTVSYIYNATATKYTDDGSKVKYYVAYEGEVKAGIDFTKIDFDINEDEKIIRITVPAVDVQETSINMGTLDFIFVKDKYNTENISQEAYKLCLTDLAERAEEEALLHEMARANAISAVEALFKPWIMTVDDTYTIHVE